METTAFTEAIKSCKTFSFRFSLVVPEGSFEGLEPDVELLIGGGDDHDLGTDVTKNSFGKFCKGFLI